VLVEDSITTYNKCHEIESLLDVRAISLTTFFLIPFLFRFPPVLHHCLQTLAFRCQGSHHFNTLSKPIHG